MIEYKLFYLNGIYDNVEGVMIHVIICISSYIYIVNNHLSSYDYILREEIFLLLNDYFHPDVTNIFLLQKI
jgi:hypothetical protein